MHRFMLLIGPGILVAATGIGAGDLATASFTGSHLGVAVLWAVPVGAAMKFVVSEGLARWQLSTGTTLLKGASLRLGRPVQYIFLVYLLLWSFFVGSALISACGVTAQAIFPLWKDDQTGKIIWGICHSAVGVVLVRWGSFRLFENVMRLFIGVMFVTVIVTAGLLVESWEAIFRGLYIPSIPYGDGEGVSWTVALIGGVGGTVTILCYGYWIQEAGRHGVSGLKVCRIDLAIAYTMTALFGLAMLIVGSTLEIEKEKSSQLIVALANQLEKPLGTFSRWTFLIGAWGAVSSSLLGVWQSVPYLFADFYGILRAEPGGRDLRQTPAYRNFLYGLAMVPLTGLFYHFREIQKWYALIGAGFMPLLALVLLLMNSRSEWIGKRLRNGWVACAALLVTVLFFVVFGAIEIQRRW